MRGGRWLATIATVAASASMGAPRLAAAQLAVTITGPPGDTLTVATPEFVARLSGVAPADRPVTLTIEVSERSDFSGPLLFTASAVTDTLRATPATPFPENLVLFWRARARTASGREVVSAVAGPRTSATWLTLVFPNAPAGVTVSTRRPRFIWRTAAVTVPPGPWLYQLVVESGQTTQAFRFRNLRDTSFTMPFDLEVNTSYRWTVTASLRTGEVATVNSRSSFVIFDPGVPQLTLLYQNFPNPFPTPTVLSTCVWFDLRRDGTVELTIVDIRGQRVRTLAPASEVPARLPAGRYGRGVGGTNTGCDPRFSWDGRADNGDVVHPGVYLVRLRADGKESFKKILFRGR